MVEDRQRTIEVRWKLIAGFIGAFFFGLLLWMGLAAPAEALSVKQDVGELSDRADPIVVGTVEGVNSQWNQDHTLIYTTVTVDVDEYLKGSRSQNTVEVVIPGGQVGDDILMVSDTPVFSAGEKVTLFLNQIEQPRMSAMGLEPAQAVPPLFRVCGSYQGKFSVQNGRIGSFSIEEFKAAVKELSIANKPLHPDMYLPVASYSASQAPTVYSYSYAGFKWPGDFPNVSYYINSDMSADQSTAIQAAASTWSAAGAKFRFSYAGTTTAVVYTLNSKNEILFRNLGDVSTIAQTWIWRSSSSTISECDMELNSYFSWSTAATTPGDDFDVQTLTLHEFGHFLCLDDLYSSSDSAKVMYGYGSEGQMKRSLTSDDIAGIKAIYGQRLGIPTLTSPANGATVSGTSVTYKWNAVSGATRYYIYIATSPSFGVTNKYEGQVTGTSFTDTGYSNDGTRYYWCLYAGDAYGYAGQSATRYFTNGTGGGVTKPTSAPTLTSPANGSTASGTSVTYNWSAVSGATQYYIYIATSPSFGATNKYEGVVGSTSYTDNGYANSGTRYYWCVYPGNSAGYGPQSTVWNFTNGSGGGVTKPTSAPTLTSPTNGTTIYSSSVTYTWNAVAGATKYYIYIATSPSFGATNKYEGEVGGTSFTDTGYPRNGTVYYWCVYAGNSAGYGPQSVVRRFTSR